MAKKSAPKEICPRQERFPTTADGLVTTAIPTGNYIDYETNSPGEFQITQPASGHESFMYPSHTRGKKNGRE